MMESPGFIKLDTLHFFKTVLNEPFLGIRRVFLANGIEAEQGSVTFEFNACSTGKVEAARRGPFLFPTYLGR